MPEVPPAAPNARRRLWREIPWPWELELLTLLILLGGLFLAVWYQYAHTPGYQHVAEAVRRDLGRDTWLILSLLAYGGHLLLSRSANRDVSTPFHLIASPGLFTILSFFHFRSAYVYVHGAQAWQYPWLEAVLLLIGVVSFTLLLARVRMQRVMLPFRDERWEIEVAPAVGTQDRLARLLRIHPVLYPPLRYRANRSGIEIEGLFYVCLVSYAEISAIGLRKRGAVTDAGVYLVRSMENLVSIQIKGRKEPLVLSPVKAEVFADFTLRRLRAFRPDPATGLHQTGRD